VIRFGCLLFAVYCLLFDDSAEGYTTKQSCKDGIELVKGTTNAPVIDDD
jgi:hypothetical protein